MVGNCIAQRIAQGEPPLRRAVQRLCEELEVAASAFLGVIHRGVGVAHQCFDVVTVFGKKADADAAAHMQFVAFAAERGDHRIERFLRDECGMVAAGGKMKDEDELVAAQSSHAVVFAHAFQQALGCHAQHAVADMVAERVVDVLEVVEVEEQQRDLRSIAMRLRDGLLQPVLQQAAVG